ncbi:MAG: hypothetical protein J6B29_02880 [Clostridia bacterium]|nr:hypothetical protein [Clostridia bacterium]
MINSKYLKREIPNFFVLDGKSIEDKDSWEIKRNELKRLFLAEEYGERPSLAYSVTSEEQGINFAGKARWESVFFKFEGNGESHTVRCELVLPRVKMKSPVFVFANFSPSVPDKYLPTEEIIDSGFGVFSFYYEDVTKDNNDFTDGLCKLISFETGKISIWSYMASTCMDYLCTRDDVDKSNVAIVGHSRLGKTALLTSALDERFKLTCANESGCCGASISRDKRKENESLEDITRVFPQWFCKSFSKYISAPNSLPFDQHMLLALIAPRYLVVGGALEDVWADNEGQLLACSLSAKAWSFYGKRGLSYDAKEDNQSAGVAFYMREGSHFMSRFDWQVYMRKFREIIEEEQR